jgi:Lysine methyltransferase
MNEISRQESVGENYDISLHASYIIERYTYSRPTTVGVHVGVTEHLPLQVTVQSATTTIGNQIISDHHDATGIMIWPATHLLCQYLAAHWIVLGDHVLELGCGCGLVGVTALLSDHPPSLWVSTDMDDQALELCRKNFALNHMRADEVDSNRGAWIRNLRWGDIFRADEILQELRQRLSVEKKFDAVVGADIIYPSTCGQVLLDLFHTVDSLLQPNGTFWLAFATRDGPRTPSRLLEVASEAGFAVDSVPPMDKTIIRLLPPLLDSKILILSRSSTAKEQNQHLGADDCRVFPKLRASLARLEEASSEEEWEAPFGSDDG